MQSENGARTSLNVFKHRAKTWVKLEAKLSAFMILTNKKHNNLRQWVSSQEQVWEPLV